MDLWGDEGKPSARQSEKPAFRSADFDVSLQVSDDLITIKSDVNLNQEKGFLSLLGVKRTFDDGEYTYELPMRAANAYVLRYLLKNFKVEITPHVAKRLKVAADKIPQPIAFVSKSGKHIELQIPPLEDYKSIVRSLNGYPTQSGRYRIPLTRALDFETIASTMDTEFPKFLFDKSVRELNRAKIDGFDGTLDSLKNIPIDVLNVVKADSQSWKAKKQSKKTLAEKLEKFGIGTLYDLLMWLPTRYIDKTSPQEIRDLMVNEPATILGSVSDVSSLPKNMGVRFTVKTDMDSEIPVSFWRQNWLRAKFPVGTDVLVTGKLTFWNRDRQLNGTSIETAKEAALLPIVPVYKQSESKGITTAFLVSAVRELFSRLGPIQLPEYLQAKARIDYYDAFKELHLPENLQKHKDVINSLAYYELVFMQLIIQEAKERSLEKSGIVVTEGDRKLQKKAVKSLPFKLTNAQVKAVEIMNEKFAKDTPSSTLLNADVGAGKGLRENEVVLTPTGWRKIKDLQVGDFVTGKNGKPTKVMGVYPQGLQNVARVSFKDGTSVITDLEHRWTVMPLGQYKGKDTSREFPERVITTGQMLSKEKTIVEIEQHENNSSYYKKKMLRHTYFEKNKNYYRWKIPLLSSPVEYENYDEPPLHPYLLGYWLGDEFSYGNGIAVGKKYADEVKTLLEKSWRGSIEKVIDKRNHRTKLKFRGELGERGKFIEILRSMNLYKNKYIPEKYLRATPADRLALLQGLIDSNGSIYANGSIEFGNNNKNLIDGILDLTRSLGGVAWIRFESYKKYSKDEKTVRSPNLSYRVTIQMPQNLIPSLLTRKRNNFNRIALKRSQPLSKIITNVEILDHKERTVCIKVDSDDELFVTKDYIVTHNTLVAQLSCLQAIDSGYQAVLIGPTEVLAQQLYNTFVKLNEGLKKADGSIEIVYLSGSLKAAEKKKILAKIKSGEIDAVVGTHSVMSDSVEYANLGFIAIDEQQKFGAEQRTKLLQSRADGSIPDLLMQTATPIPRSTAQVFYGDIDILTLNEKPPGRLPIITKWIKDDPNDVIIQILHPMWSDIQDEANKGNQTFIVTPMVRDSATIDAASVQRTYETLSKSFSNLRIGFIHGQMKKTQQKETMDAFREREFDVLVSSTVVEVGVDIPDATRVVILSADRLGASSLHQIRGRVGRSDKQSICYLVSLGLTENSQIRLDSLVKSNDGFEVAKADLQVRGEGTMFNNSQSGASEMMFATLYRHGQWVERARTEALDILSSPLRVEALEDSKKRFQTEGRLM